MIRDPILEEVWRAKEQVAAEYGYDVVRLIRSLPQAVGRPDAGETPPAPPKPKRSRKPAAG